MIAAFIALVGALGGVIVGAALTERRDQKRERITHQDEARVAARLVGQELQSIYTQTLGALGEPVEIDTSSWESERPVLARRLDETGWRDVSSAYVVLQLIATGRESINDGTEKLVRKASIKLAALADWSRDERTEDEVLYAYQVQLERLVSEKRRLTSAEGPRKESTSALDERHLGPRV